MECSLRTILLVNEKPLGKEKLKVVLKKLGSVVDQSQFGDPVTGTTSYNVCIYNENDVLVGEMEIDRAQENCGTRSKPCWKAISDKGWVYKDSDTTADGIQKIVAKGGDAGKGKVIVSGKNNASKGQTSLPTGIAAALLNNSKAKVQVVTSDAHCFGVTTTDVKTADGLLFKPLGGLIRPSGSGSHPARGIAARRTVGSSGYRCWAGSTMTTSTQPEPDEASSQDRRDESAFEPRYCLSVARSCARPLHPHFRSAVAPTT